jgi:site-specific DNA recombinase
MGTNDAGTAAIYLRISADPSGERAGVERQRQDCEQLAERLNLDVVAIYEDNDVSAYSGKRRPQFEAMILAAQAGGFDTLIIWHADRLYRRMSDLVRITAELAPHVRILSVTGGKIDLSNASGVMNAQIHGSVAEYESRHKAERIARRAKQRAEEGVMTTATRPFGWQWAEPCDGTSTCRHARSHAPGDRARVGSRAGLVIAPTEAAILAECYRRVAAGDTLRGTWKWATANGLAMSGSDVLARSLQSPRHAGLVAHRGTVVAEAANGLAIIDRATWDRVQAILADPSRRTSTGRPANTRLGGGIALCPKCGGPLAGTEIEEAHGRVPNYMCSRHHHYRRARHTLDPLVLDVVGDTLTEMAVSGRLTITSGEDTAGAAIRAEIAQVEERLGELAALAATGDLPPQDYALVAKSLRAKMDTLSATLSRRTGRPALASLAADQDGLGAAWERLATAEDPEPLRAVLREVLVSVVPRSDGTATLTWQEWTGLEPETLTYVAGPREPSPAMIERRAKVAEAHGRGWHNNRIAKELGLRYQLVDADMKALGLEPHRIIQCGPQPGRVADIAARRARVAELRAEGLSHARIAEALSTSPMTVARDLKAIDG